MTCRCCGTRLISGDTNVLRLEIEIKGETGKDILAGNLFVVGTITSTNVFRFTCRGNLNPRREMQPGMPFMGGMSQRMSMPIMFAEGCEILFDERGNILRESGDPVLQVPLGQVLHTLVEPLPQQALASWQVSSPCGVMDEPVVTGPAASFMDTSGFRRLMFMGYRPGTIPGLLTATETASYTITDAKTANVIIHKRSRAL